MMEVLDAIRHYFADRTALQLARDGFDVVVVYSVVYLTLRVIRGTRAMQVGMGLVIVFLFYLIARALQLVTVLTIMDAVLGSMILVLVVVFQNDIRRGLMRVGSRGQDWFGSPRRAREAEMIDEVVDAVTELARHRIGALITFERDANLDEFVGTNKGQIIDAKVSQELLVSLFLPEAMNKMHDGSVIIADFRISKAGVFFPMPESKVMDEGFGSRHRAALGITEETDAIVIVVSEERGTISLCFNGNIIPGLDGPTLRKSLEDFFSPKPRKRKRLKTPAPTVGEPAAAEETIEEAPLSRRGPEVAEQLGLEAEGGLPIRVSRPAVEVDAPAPLRKSEPGSEPPPPLRKAKAEETPSPAAAATALQVVPMPSGPDSSRRGSNPSNPLIGPDDEASSSKPDD